MSLDGVKNTNFSPNQYNDDFEDIGIAKAPSSHIFLNQQFDNVLGLNVVEDR
jgi:hypothetical protein